MNWNPIDEGWTLVWAMPGVGAVYHFAPEPEEDVHDEDAPDIDLVNDEGEVDETEVPGQVWMVRGPLRETFTKDSEAWARKVLTMMTRDQFDLFV